jgi:hypothetical protein
VSTAVGERASLSAIASVERPSSGVDPASYSNTLTHGQSVTITKTVHTPAIPPKVDIMFLADTTGSMGPAISNVQTNAVSILNQVRLAQPDTQFGAANYRDFNCPADPFAYQLNQGITANLTNAQNGINAWTIGDGCDIPEAQINALFQVASDPASNFRAGSTRVVVWFGDSNGNDPSGGHSLADAIAALQAAHIEVIAIPVTTDFGNGLDSTGQATAVAFATGGQVLPSATPDQVTAAILTGLSNLPVTVTPVPTCDVGLSATYDAPSKTVVSGTDATFLETLTVATDAPEGGTLHCNVDFLLNGNHQDGFQQVVNIDVPEQPITATGGFSFSGTEPASVSGTVATFTDPDTFATAGEYTASIDWGDGSLPSSGTITGGSGSFSVSGAHIYTEEGSYTITVKITDIDNAGNSATVTDSASVADAALTASCATVANSVQAFSGSVASFVDANPIGTLSDFSATIDWGDSSSSTGTVSGSGPFTVSGSHTYATTGFFTITTSIKDVGGSTASTACKVLVFAFAPGSGSFVIGNNNSATGTSVTFWGAQWWKLNSLTGGAAPASFKGFALNPATPACGTGWSTDPGNSAPPPAGPLPAFMGVIVSSSITKSGSQISGDTPHIVIVQTNPGYAANPGHAGTGTVVAQFC